jgi:hypothetical protein
MFTTILISGMLLGAGVAALAGLVAWAVAKRTTQE